MSSLALTDALLCLVVAFLVSQTRLPAAHRLAFAVLGLAALLGALKFSGVYPLDAWHRLWTIWSGSAALPLLAVCVVWPHGLVAQQRQFTLIFLCAVAALGLAIAGLAQLRVYDQVLGALSMLILLWTFARRGQGLQALGVLIMLLGSVLFLAKAQLSSLLVPGDFLHLGMALGLLVLAHGTARSAGHSLFFQPNTQP